jgi:hypothetical protein
MWSMGSRGSGFLAIPGPPCEMSLARVPDLVFDRLLNFLRAKDQRPFSETCRTLLSVVTEKVRFEPKSLFVDVHPLREGTRSQVTTCRLCPAKIESWGTVEELEEKGASAVHQLASFFRRRQRLEHLKVPFDDPLLWVLGKALLLQPCPKLSIIEHNEGRLTVMGMRPLCEAMKMGCLPSLTTFDLLELGFEPSAAAPLLDALDKGACPLLSGLSFDLGSLGFGLRTSQAHDLARILQRRMTMGCRGLRQLNVSNRGSVQQACVADILASGACDMLEEINLCTDIWTNEVAEMVGEYMRVTRSPALSRLSIALNFEEPDLEPISQALSMGAAPNLTYMWICYLEGKAVHDLAQAFESGALAKLESLYLIWVHSTERLWLPSCEVFCGVLTVAVPSRASSLIAPIRTTRVKWIRQAWMLPTNFSRAYATVPSPI